MTTPLDGRSTRWDAHRAQRRQALVQAAVNAIEHHGASVRVDQIAEQAEIARPLLYRYFGDLTALQRAIIEHAQTQLLAQIGRLWQPNQPLEALVESVVVGYFAWVAQHPMLSRYCLRHTDAGLVDELRQHIATQILQVLRGVLADEPVATLQQAWALGLVGLVEAQAVWWLDQPEPPSVSITTLSTHVVQQVHALVRRVTHHA
jgi:AcrR family transcriptional regulator